MQDRVGVAFHDPIFGLPIYWYGILMATAVLMGIFIGMNRAKKLGYKSDQVIDFMLFAVPLGIVFARLYYIVFDIIGNPNSTFLSNPVSVFYLRDGGLAMYGALIGSVLAAFINSRRKKDFGFLKEGISFIDIMDIVAAPLVLGQAIGRWGNYFNQEAYGSLAPQGWGFPFAVYIEDLNEWHLATFFYECVWNLLVFAFLMWYSRKRRKPGNVFLFYLAGYGLGRMVIEQFRADSLWLVPGMIRISQLLSFIFLVGAGSILFFRYRNKKKFAEEEIIVPESDAEIVEVIDEQVIDEQEGENDIEGGEDKGGDAS